MGGIATLDAGLVLAEHHVEHPVTGVFDVPMGAAELQILCGVGRQAADVVAGFLPDLALAKRGLVLDADPCRKTTRIGR